jgi:hypothetical protein
MGYVGSRKHGTFRLKTDLTVLAVGDDPLLFIFHLCFYQITYWNFNGVFKSVKWILNLKVKVEIAYLILPVFELRKHHFTQ